MRLLCLASLASAAAAMTCAIVGGGNGLCRSCPSTRCDIIVQYPSGNNVDFSCVWPRGEDISGDK